MFWGLGVDLSGDLRVCQTTFGSVRRAGTRWLRGAPISLRKEVRGKGRRSGETSNNKEGRSSSYSLLLLSDSSLLLSQAGIGSSRGPNGSGPSRKRRRRCEKVSSNGTRMRGIMLGSRSGKAVRRFLLPGVAREVRRNRTISDHRRCGGEETCAKRVRDARTHAHQRARKKKKSTAQRKSKNKDGGCRGTDYGSDSSPSSCLSGVLSLYLSYRVYVTLLFSVQQLRCFDLTKRSGS